MIADFMDQFEKLDFAIAKLKRKPIKIQNKGDLEKGKNRREDLQSSQLHTIFLQTLIVDMEISNIGDHHNIVIIILRDVPTI
jgi:hypothetical protein